MPDTSVLIPYPNAQHEFGEFIGDNLKNVANQGADIVCQLYKDYPGFMTGQAFNNPIAPYNDGLLNSLCEPRNLLPDAPTVPFDGGQCVCVNYLIAFTATGLPGGSESGTIVIPGAVSPPVKNYSGTSIDGQKVYTWGWYGGSTACGGRQYYAYLTNASENVVVTVNSATRQDGLPDECGNMPPTYPREVPGGDTLNFPTTINTSPNITINAPVSVFAPVNNFTPQIKIGDFNFDFNLGGLEIGLDPNFTLPPGKDVPTLPPVPQPGNNQQDRNYDAILAELLKYAKRLRECQDCDDDYSFLFTGGTSGNAASITVPSGGIPISCGISISVVPTNAREEPGAGEPRVLYAGWAWFEGNGFLGERMPIDADNKLFIAPQNPAVQKFRWTMRIGFNGSAIMSYKVKRNPLPPV